MLFLLSLLCLLDWMRVVTAGQNTKGLCRVRYYCSPCYLLLYTLCASFLLLVTQFFCFVSCLFMNCCFFFLDSGQIDLRTGVITKQSNVLSNSSRASYFRDSNIYSCERTFIDTTNNLMYVQMDTSPNRGSMSWLPQPTLFTIDMKHGQVIAENDPSVWGSVNAFVVVSSSVAQGSQEANKNKVVVH